MCRIGRLDICTFMFLDAVSVNAESISDANSNKMAY